MLAKLLAHLANPLEHPLIQQPLPTPGVNGPTVGELHEHETGMEAALAAAAAAREAASQASEMARRCAQEAHAAAEIARSDSLPRAVALEHRIFRRG